jgi:hypothetical protein
MYSWCPVDRGRGCEGWGDSLKGKKMWNPGRGDSRQCKTIGIEKRPYISGKVLTFILVVHALKFNKAAR